MQSFSTCPACKGTKFQLKTDIMNAATVRAPCERCGGTGEIKEQQTDGIRCGRKIGETFFWQNLKDGHVVATLEIRICPVMMNGITQFRINGSALFKKQQRVPRLYVEIVRMTTIPSFRRKGIMKELVARSIGDPKIEWAETNLEDSSEEGIALLKGLGFYEEGKKLIKEMNLGTN